MKIVTLIVGNISFDDDTAKIHEIHYVERLEHHDAVDKGEDMLGDYDAYIIPEIFNTTPIIFENL